MWIQLIGCHTSRIDTLQPQRQTPTSSLQWGYYDEEGLLEGCHTNSIDQNDNLMKNEKDELMFI